MSKRKLAIMSGKGGTGKTSTAVNLSAELARTGHTVLLIDSDVSGQASRALGVNPSAGLAELILDGATPDSVLFEARPGLCLLAGGRRNALVAVAFSQSPYGLADALEPIDKPYDYVIIDNGPGWDALALNTLHYATEILAPVALEGLAVIGFVSFLRQVQDIQKRRPELRLAYILPTFADGRVRKSQDILGQLQNQFGNLVLPPIHYNVKVSEAAAWGKTVAEHAPHSAGAVDYCALAERVCRNGKTG